MSRQTRRLRVQRWILVALSSSAPLWSCQAASLPSRSDSAAATSRADSLKAAWQARGGSAVADAGQLALRSGTVLSSSVDVGNPFSYPSVQFSYTADAAGLNSVTVEFSSPDGAQTYSGLYYQAGYTTRGDASFASTFPLSLYSVPGEWTLTSATIYDNAGNSVTYDAQTLQRLFVSTSFRLINTGLSDGLAPTILGGRILSDTVSLSARLPLFKAEIAATDGGSGLYKAYVFIRPPGLTSSVGKSDPLPTPAGSAQMDASNFIDKRFGAGTWAITGYLVCDVAENCAGSNASADVQTLFGTTTFTVQN